MKGIINSSNPAFNSNTFSNVDFSYGVNSMTVSGAINKTIFSIVLTILGGLYAWYTPNSLSLAIPMGILGIVIALITIFKPTISPYTVPLYAVVEGIFLGALSLMIESKVAYTVNDYGQTVESSFRGIAGQAVALTFGVFFVMLFLYKFKIIRATEKFKSVIISSTLAIASVYFIFWVSSFFGVKPFIYGSSIISILFSVFVVVIASMNLIIDFDNVEKGASNGAPKYMEWYSAFGILVTLVWLYIEILRLLSKLASRN